MSWDTVSFVLRAKARRAVLFGLASPKTPTILAKELHTSIPNISRALRELKSKNLITSLTPNVKTGKLYVASKEGQEVVSKIEEITASRGHAK